MHYCKYVVFLRYQNSYTVDNIMSENKLLPLCVLFQLFNQCFTIRPDEAGREASWRLPCCYKAHWAANCKLARSRETFFCDELMNGWKLIGGKPSFDNWLKAHFDTTGQFPSVIPNIIYRPVLVGLRWTTAWEANTCISDV